MNLIGALMFLGIVLVGMFVFMFIVWPIVGIISDRKEEERKMRDQAKYIAEEIRKNGQK